MAGILNFGGALWGTHVATTIAKGIADSNMVVPAVLVAALSAAILWNLITWWFGIPSSSSHALVGALAGAVVAHAGWKALHFDKLKEVGTFLIVSPIVGFFLGMILILIILWTVKGRPGHKLNQGFRKLQLVSAGFMALAHGTSDAQKSMGIIALALITFGKLSVVGAKVPVPVWVKLACAMAMGLGTMSGGWKIIKTMGSKIVKLRPIHGFAAETSAALVLFTTAHWGIPVSTTHVISGSIMGVGASMNVSAVRWGVAANILVAWVLTIPLSALFAMGILKLIAPWF
jgi:PiT family inorganic phosphate transporter